MASSDIEKQLASLSPAKRALLERKLREAVTPMLRRAQGRATAPLSSAQQRFWLIQQMDPTSYLYNVPRLLRLKGKLNLEALEASLNEIVRRHEALRTTFNIESGQPVQLVAPELHITLPLREISPKTGISALDAAVQDALQEYRRPFDLATGPILRAGLWKLGEDDHLLLLLMHHIVSDGWSGGVLFDELGNLYDAFAAGKSSPLPELPLQYGDFAAWERESLERIVEKQLGYWKEQLAGAPPMIDLPTDRLRSSDADFRGHLGTLTLDADLAERVLTFAKKQNTTLFPVMLAALQVLLFRWIGRSDLVLGTLSANRNTAELEKLIGCFLNFLALREEVNGSDTASALIDKDKKTVLEAFANQDCPFERVVEAVNPERIANGNPLYNVALLVQNYPAFAFRGGDVEAHFLPVDARVAFLDLRFLATESEGAIILECEAKAELFDKSTVNLLLHGLRDVLEQITANPVQKIDQIQIPRELVRQGEARASQSLAISATFTGEPLQPALNFWTQQLGISAKIKFAPFNQVFQQLLDPSSLFSKNRRGVNIVLLRLEDLVNAEGASSDLDKSWTAAADELVKSLRAAAPRSQVSYCVALCPPSGDLSANFELAQTYSRVEQSLAAKLAQIPRVTVVRWQEVLKLYPVSNYLDDYAWQIGKVPYAASFFAALATMIARCIYSMKSPPREVIVADCDQTLWGTSNDASPIEVGVNHRTLQEFLIAEQDAGRILCLCSSQPKEAVEHAFASPAMKVGWQHIAESRFGDQPITEKLKQLADDLGLELSNFLFVSSDPNHCAEVRQAYPHLTVAEAPTDENQLATYLMHFWPFDRYSSSASGAPMLTIPSQTVNEIALRFSTVEAIAEAVASNRTVRAQSRAEYVAPRNAVEEILAGVWARLLRTERLGIHDNFFALGGHSLLAVQVIARVRQVLGIEMPLRALFDAPTIAQFAEQIEAACNTGKPVLPPLKPVPRTGRIPLSYAQQRLWFIDQLEPGNALYNISGMYRLSGALNLGALRQALNEIVRRHETLRTSFPSEDGEPVQVIAPDLQIDLPVTVRTEIAAAERETVVQQFAHEEASKAFNLATGPLFRASLLKLDDEDHVLLVILHHIVGDGWSGAVLANEITALYESFVSGQPSSLAQLSTQYADFASWQREWMRGGVLDAQLAYWKKQLAGAPPVLELPTDRPRPAVQEHRGALSSRLISKSLLEQLRSLSHAEGATLFMTLLSAFQLLLSRYSGQDDVVVGSTVAGRNQAQVEPLIGFFINTLALRTHLSGEPTFRELLARVKQTALDGLANQDLPFEKLVEELQPQRSLSHNPIFQVLFNLQVWPKTSFEISGLNIQRESAHASTSLFDMSWFAFEGKEGLLLRVEYDTDLFDEQTIARFLSHFEQLLSSIVAHPEFHTSKLDVLPEAERHRVLVEFNDNSAAYRADLCLHDFFQQQAMRSPGSVAVVCDAHRLTYGELDKRSNQLAHYLLKEGAGPDVLVGICCERTPELLVGILGILKSGSAYVPIDPAYPKDRIAHILEDANASVVLTQESLAGELPPFAGKTICLDSGWENIAKESDGPLLAQVRPDNLAYVLFTSGSTGRPKGVALEHRSAATFVQWAQSVFTPAELAGVLFSTSVCFDLSIFEMFVPLSVGGKIIIVQNALYLPSAEARDEVTLINTVPSAMTELVRMGAIPKSVKTINLAGEALAQALVNEIYSNTSVEKLYNLYGPTEDTTYSTYTLTQSEHKVTIGRPLPNTQAYVLDLSGNPQPVGVSGELFLAGAGLARGYFGRPDLTGERFIANPFGKLNSRMYRTGDLCRWLPSGELEYLGRLDHQIKLRGFRIELGEIESVLAKYPGVTQCLVMAREDQPGLKRLVAYLVLAQASGFDEELLRQHLKQSVPEFMVPSAFVMLDAFPLTPNGKIDRKALPAPEFTVESENYVAPRNGTEGTLAGIWAEVLHLEKVGVNDDFFSLGGHSLLATQVISRIRKLCGVDLPLRALFESPTVAGLATRIEQQGAKLQQPPVIARASRDHELALSFAQQRLWFLSQLEPDNPFYNIPQGLRMRGQLDVAALERSLNEIVRRHDVLRTTYRIERGKTIQVISADLNVALSVIDFDRVSENERPIAVQRFIDDEARRPFDLEKGPVIRAKLLRLASDEHILILNTHHIASDGWSMGIFVRELTELYSAFVQDKPSPLAELPIQYSDFALWQREWIRGDVLNQHLEYWRKQLKGAPAAIELPADRTRPAVQSFRGDKKTILLPPETAQKIRDFCQREGVTLYMAALAAFQTLLFRYTGQDDVVVGSPIANRNYAETENLIGFFVNALTMRTNLSGNPTFRDLLGRVRDVALGAYAHQDLPFERLVEEFDPERSLGHNPLFQVLLVVQNAPKYALTLPGLELEWLNIYNGTAKFDLALHIAETRSGLSCMLEFNTDLFDESTVLRMLGHLRTLLEAAISHPEQRISTLALLTSEERQKLLVEFNQTANLPAPDKCVHQWVEAQAARTPHNTAVTFENQSLSYRELNARANQLARYLQKQGVGPETLVAMCVERSLDMIVGILGILKAGGAYLPLDLAYPADRLTFMLEDAKPAVVLTQQKLKAKLPEHNSTVIYIDADWQQICAESNGNVESGVRPENLAYVIYTSGSTGKPKGCLVTHFNVVRLFQSTWDWYKFDEHDVWTMFHSYAFDFSVWEIWGALFYGGRVVVVPYLVSRSPEDFYRLLQKEGVTVLNQTPSSFKQLIQAEESVGMHNLALRYVIFGGEALDMQSLKPWYERHGDRKPALVNMYGITETTVHVTYRPLSVKDTNGGSVIGRPIPDLQLYILDQQRQPVPIGVAGEMYVGGAGVARGYLNRAELTNERFIPDGFSSRSGARLYKTGDLARFLANGDVEYLGRIDHQVKIRGFRIELGEIESVLASHPAVRHSIVMAREDEPGNKQLVAYIVSDKQAPLEDASAGAEGQQVSQWETTFDETYTRGTEEDPAFNITGWNSSYTAEPIPADHMREWVDHTVERIHALHPRRVLEIGCGTGLLLFRVAPECEKYLATDFSKKAIDRLQRFVANRGISQVSLAQRPGDNFDGIPRDGFDTAIINSVAQYFPSIEYLLKVLEGAIESVAPGGRIFIGDNRSLPLLDAFHTAVVLYQSPDSLSLEQFAQRVRTRISQDEELVIDPGFFHALKQRIPKISHVEIQIKRGWQRNEMSEFRYDVVLHIGQNQLEQPDCSWLDWGKDQLSLTAIEERLKATPSALAISGVPNARVAAAVDALQEYPKLSQRETVGALKTIIGTMSVHGSVEPEDLWSLASRLGYDVKANWATGESDGTFNLVFRRHSDHDWVMPPAPSEPRTYRAPETYANNPMAVAISRTLVPQLRRIAGAKLPEYMVPSAFVVLDKLPLTENGKVDRKALPAPDQSRRDVEQGYVAPRTPTEEMLAAIWADVLRLERIGIHDDFFELGGHSLNATQVVSRVREAFRVELPLRAMFETPTVEGLAQSVSNLRRNQSEEQAPPMVAVSRDHELPLSFAQQRLWFLDQMDPGNHLYNVPRAIRLRGRLDVDAMENALNGIIARHEILRTTYAVVSDQPVQKISSQLKIALPLVDLTSLPLAQREEEAARLVQAESDKGFNLASDPILRALVIKLADDDHVLFLNTHHIASDGWSSGVMLNDLSALYRAAVEKRSADLRPLEIQYADYAVWQRNWLKGEVLEQQLAYWKSELAGAPALLSLPTDRPRPAVQTFHGAVYEHPLPANLVETLRLLGRQHGSTLFMTLLAGFKSLLHHYTGEPDLIIGTDLANRTSVQTEALIGFFVNLLVIRTDASGNPSFEQLIKRVREVTLRAYAHQDLPFDKLVEELRPERNLTHSPLVQVLFVQQNAPKSTGSMPGLQLDRFRLEVPSKFDMAVFVSETENQVTGRWVYNPDLFDASTVRRMANLYETLLQAATLDPAAPLSQICKDLSEAENRMREAEQKSFHETSLRKLKGAKRKVAAVPAGPDGNSE